MKTMRDRFGNLWLLIMPREGFHARRWRLLLYWVVAFTLIVAYSLHRQSADAKTTQDRFCDVATAFITSNITLRSAQNEASAKTVGQRQKIIATDDQLIGFFKLSNQTTPGAKHFNQVLVTWFQAQIALERNQSEAARESLAASNVAIDKWESLRRKLKC
jgi:uncharacterized protein with beta-barrel porin domain